MPATISDEILRITTDRNTIRTKLVSMGLATSTDNLDDLATAVAAITDQGAVEASIREGETYTIPAGYHNGSGTVVGIPGGGNYDLQAKTVTPTKSQQSITPDTGKYGLSSVTVEAIPDNYQDVSTVTATAADVLTGKVFVGADGVSTAGTMPANGAISGTIDGLTTTSYAIPAGYTSGGTVSLTNDIYTALAAI